VSVAIDFILTPIITLIIIIIINKELNCCLLNNSKMYRKEIEFGDVEWIHLAQRCLIAGSCENGKEELGLTSRELIGYPKYAVGFIVVTPNVVIVIIIPPLLFCQYQCLTI
jgi:hypothetical protein